MPQLPCPICRATVPADATHCPRCGIRIAPLERRRPTRARTVAVPSRRPSITVARRGAVGGAVLTALCVVIAAGYALLSGGFLRALGDACALAGGSAICLSLFLGGFRGFRLADPERARRVPTRRASPAARLSVAVAGAVPLGLSIALAVSGH